MFKHQTEEDKRTNFTKLCCNIYSLKQKTTLQMKLCSIQILITMGIHVYLFTAKFFFIYSDFTVVIKCLI